MVSELQCWCAAADADNIDVSDTDKSDAADIRWKARWEVDHIWRSGGRSVDWEYELSDGRQQDPHSDQWRTYLHARAGPHH